MFTCGLKMVMSLIYPAFDRFAPHLLYQTPSFRIDGNDVFQCLNDWQQAREDGHVFLQLHKAFGWRNAWNKHLSNKLPRQIDNAFL